MIYRSTRGGKDEKNAAQAVIQGISQDKGLFVPKSIPRLPFALEEMKRKTYQEIAFAVIQSFFTDYTTEEIQHCVNGAYDNKFNSSESSTRQWSSIWERRSLFQTEQGKFFL